jgi:5-formyltetrahydrofolate cyclo-ligase
MRRARRRLSIADRLAAERSIAAWLPRLPAYRDAAGILAYVATEHEFPTRALTENAWASGKKVYLPRVVGDELEFATHQPGVALRAGRFGIPEPDADAVVWTSFDVPTVAFVPLVAWDDTGTRLGRGGGFYDRALSSMRPSGVIGLGYAFQRYTALPCDPWDVKLDYIATERGVLYCGRRESQTPVRKEDVNFNDICVDRVDRRRIGRGPRRGHGLPTTPTDGQ